MTRAFLREVIYERIPGKKEGQEIEGAGREKDIQIIPALEGGRSSLPVIILADREQTLEIISSPIEAQRRKQS